MTTTTFGRDATRSQANLPHMGLMGRVRNFLARSRAERQLDQLDDRLLADIGVKRSDIRRMVWGD